MQSKDESKEIARAKIMHMFRYTYRNEWAPESLFKGKSRIWVKTFNELIEEGFIKKRKKYPGYQYKWGAVWPDGY